MSRPRPGPSRLSVLCPHLVEEAGGNMPISPAEVQQFLRGIDFSCDKETLVEQARDQGAVEEMLDFLEDLAGQIFDSAAHVSRAIGQVE